MISLRHCLQDATGGIDADLGSEGIDNRPIHALLGGFLGHASCSGPQFEQKRLHMFRADAGNPDRAAPSRPSTDRVDPTIRRKSARTLSTGPFVG